MRAAQSWTEAIIGGSPRVPGLSWRMSMLTSLYMRPTASSSRQAQVGLAFGSGSTCKGHKEPALRDRREPPGIDHSARSLLGSRKSDPTECAPVHATQFKKVVRGS